MQLFWKLSVLASSLAFGLSLAQTSGSNNEEYGPTVVHSGGVKDIIITKDNTINATNGSPPSGFRVAASANLPLALVNNIRAGPVTAYVTGTDPSGRLVFLMNNGQWYYPQAQQGNTTPQPVTGDIGIALGAFGSTKQLTLPDYITSGRIYFAIGQLKFFTIYPAGATGPSLVTPAPENPQDPNAGVRWAFVELTNTVSGLFANLSFVDFVGIVTGMALKTKDGRTLSVPGLRPGSLVPICDALKATSKNDSQPWGNMCMADSSGNILRALAPPKYLGTTGPKFSGYFTNYVNQVWQKYATTTLTIDTQGAAGRVACRVTGDVFTCNGSDKTYAKPIARDIFGCASGPFTIDGNDVHKAIVPRFCAAFNRATLLLGGGEVQPSLPATSYYKVTPNNQYSRIVHSFEIEGRGYAFPYDDVNPSGGPDQSGTLSDAQPSLLTVYIGGQQ